MDFNSRIEQQRGALRPPPNPRSGGGGAARLAPNSRRAMSNNTTRNKVVLQPGHSPLDWARVNSSGENIRGIEPREFPLRVSKELLQRHKSQDDCWTVLGGKVYNMTRYVDFHPGGVQEIMKCAGRDGTALFQKYHAWVNYERMLEKCLIGFYVG